MNYKPQIKYILFPRLRPFEVLLAGAILLTCLIGNGEEQVQSKEVPIPKDAPTWSPIFRGISLTTIIRQSPEPLAVYAVRIDLRAPGIKFMVTPSNGEKPGETDSRTTSTFLKEFGCQVAINASAFNPVKPEEGLPIEVLGLSISRGDVYSKPHTGYGALLINRANKAWIVEQPCNLKEAYNAVSGFSIVLRNGEKLGDDEKRHPRSLAGLSKNGRYLYLAAIDGRVPGYSVGVTTNEAADWMKHLGAYSALNLDGGGSTTLVIAEKEHPRIVNKPVSGFPLQTERPTANHLGVFASALKHTHVSK